MTNEEREIALYCLKASSDYHSEVCEECVKYPNCDHMIQDDVTETIIKALEQKPCEDCISREVVKDMLTSEWTKYMPMELDMNLSFVLDKISALPSVTPSYNSVKTELKSSEDCISRQKLLSRIDAERKHLLDLKMDGAEHIMVHHARRIIEDMPSASSVDCIDRQKTIAEIQYKYYDNAIGIDIVDMIAHMPAAIPEQLGEHFAEGYKKGVENEQTRT